MKGIGFVLRGEIYNDPLMKLHYPDVCMINGRMFVNCSIDKRTGRACPQNLIEQLRTQEVSWSAYMTTRANGGMSMVHAPLHGLVLVKDFVRIISVWRDSNGVIQNYCPAPELNGTSKLQIDENIVLCAATRNENYGVHLEVFTPYLEITPQEPVLCDIQPKKRVELPVAPPVGLAFLGLPPDSGLEEGLGEFAWLSRTIQRVLLNSL